MIQRSSPTTRLLEVSAIVVDLDFGPTSKVIVLYDQEQLSGPSQRYTIPVYVSQDTLDHSEAFVQVYIGQKRDTTICCVYFPILQQERKSICGCAEQCR